MNPEDRPGAVGVQSIAADAPVPLIIAGAGYAGLHVALRLSSAEDKRRLFQVTLVDRHPFQQVITELPRVAAGSRAADAVRLPIDRMLGQHAAFVQADVTGFDIAGRRVLTSTGPLLYRRLVLALGSRPNDFSIPGLTE